MKQLALNLAGGFDAGPLFWHGPKNYGTANRRCASGWVRFAMDQARAQPKHVPMATISAFWREARRRTKLTGVVWSVHHIVPLNGVIVCGLNVPWNLKVIPLEENMRIGNKWWPDMPFEQLEMTI